MEKQYKDNFGRTHFITKPIAEGGQGKVFRTEDPYLAIKLIPDDNGDEPSRDVSYNDVFKKKRLLPIPPNTNVTVPLAVLADCAGYVMTLLDDMESFEDAFDRNLNEKCESYNQWLSELIKEKKINITFANILSQYIRSGGRRRRLSAYMHAAMILSKLHSNGLVYGDFSLKNVLVSEVRNDIVWLIDADNLNFQENTKLSDVYYTRGFGAPEMVKTENDGSPFRSGSSSFYSDAYSFAISLFWQLTGKHPFMGALLDDSFDNDTIDEDTAYSGTLPWILDDGDDSNYTDTWPPHELVISPGLLKYFKRTFSETGKRKRHTRPTMPEWAYILAKEHDRSVKCRHCEMDYDAGYAVCPWCDEKSCRTVIKSASWEFIHESEDGQFFDVPMRIVYGASISKGNDIAFKVCAKDDMLILSGMNRSGKWHFLNGDSFKEIKEDKLLLPKSFTLKYSYNSVNEEIIIEVSTQ